MAFDSTKINRLPERPGVYLMKDSRGNVIYVGKAARLKSRVKQYFGATSDTRYFVPLLEHTLDDLEVIITSNEKEALILENELIKRHQPKFNVNLKDDKNFLHLRINTDADWPRIDIVRRPRSDGAKYFGPYHSATKIRQTTKLVERYFGLRNCDDLSFKHRSRPCLQYQIKRCPAPCVLSVDRGQYHQQVADVVRFLDGRYEELATRLRDKMVSASGEMRYEDAARYRDQITAVRGCLQDQSMVQFKELDQDVFGIYREGSFLQIAVLFIRSGRLIGSKSFSFERQGVANEEVLSTFANLFYSGGTPIPDEILFPHQPTSYEALVEYLAELKGRKVNVRNPRRGSARKLTEMAFKNAEHAFFLSRQDQAMRDGGLVRLKDTLRLQNLPHTIECFDISLFQGAEPVGSKVCFEGGVPKRNKYRKYRIKTVEGTDDYAMMREVLQRRLTRGLSEGDLPQLIVVDGGKGQLNVVRAVFEDLNVQGVDLVALAKSRLSSSASPAEEGGERSSERVFIPGIKEPIYLKPHTNEFRLMTQLRNEAHRFAIEFHRKRRRKSSLKSVLDDIPGVGPSRKKALLGHFGHPQAIASATVSDIASVPGIGDALAQEILDKLQS